MPVGATCPKCNSVVAPGSKFCGNCGAGLGPTACPKCNTPLAPGAKFCASCGQKVGE
jgi:predicted amidophosphoribosyltransferase